jgi:hypothetical protein
LIVDAEMAGLIDEILRDRTWDDERTHASREMYGAYLEEIVAHARGEGKSRPVLVSAAALGRQWFLLGLGAGELTRDLMRLGRRAQQVLPGSERLARTCDEATAQAIEGFMLGRRTRRDRWLSYLAHEMRNSLNTLVNAVWILRNSDRSQTHKICDMADRAVRKLETSVAELRELEANTASQAPGRPDEESGTLAQRS